MATCRICEQRSLIMTNKTKVYTRNAIDAYKERKKAAHYGFDLYAENTNEQMLIEHLDKAKADKKLKAVVVQALTEYFSKN